MIETDLDAMLPPDYVTNIQERLSLYRELDNIDNEALLDVFTKNLRDRFGPLPKQAEDLVNTVSLRRLAKTLGMEKIVLKQNKMVAWFVAKQDSPFYQSAQFSNILLYLQKHPNNCRMKETNGKLSLVVDNVKDITSALRQLQKME